MNQAVEDWGTFEITCFDKERREVILRRIDDNEVLTITYSSTYPKGPIFLTASDGAEYRSMDSRVGDALDEAYEHWEGRMASDENMMRGDSAAVFEAAVTGAAEIVIPEDLEKARSQLLRDTRELNGLASFFYDEAKKKFFVRVGISLNELDQMRCNALGLKKKCLCVMELSWPYQYLAATDIPKIEGVYMCERQHLEQEIPATKDPHVGAFQWFFSHRVNEALRKNHIKRERKAMGLLEHDKTHNVEGLNFVFGPYEDFYANNENILLGIHRLLTHRLNTCTKYCIVCDNELAVNGMKTGICDKALCRHAVENYGIGTDVLSELIHDPEMSELMIYFTSAATALGKGGRDTFDPMCPIDIDTSKPSHYTGPTHFYTGRYGDDHSKNFPLLHQTVQRIPKVKKMIEMAHQKDTILRQSLCRDDPLVYPLLQWIFSSNRAHLEPLPQSQRISGFGTYQYYLVSSNPEKEAVFRKKRDVAKAHKGGRGSFFAWHGSQPGNWHCILRNGLKNYSGTKLMSAGSAYGPGIYLAKNLSTSLSYVGSPMGAWTNAELIPHSTGCVCFALCEVVSEGQFKDHGNGIITVQDESLVDTRFLFVFPNGYSGNGEQNADKLADSIPEER